MTTYSYQALDVRGKKVRGVIEGDSERQARSQLRKQGLRPLRFSASDRKGGAGGGLGSLLRLSIFERSVGINDISLLTRQIAVLLNAGLPLDETLQAAAKQCRNERLKKVLLDVHARVLEGLAFAQALGEHPKIFNNLFRAMVRAGEHAGYLGPVLEQLADYVETRQQSQQKLKSAMVYPVILILVAVGVVGALMTFVVPKLVTIFENTAAELPPLTVALISISDFMNAYWLHCILGLLGVVLLARWSLQNPARQKKFHGFLLRAPFVGNLLRQLETSRFAGTLGILTRSGVPLLDALNISREVFSNLVLKDCAEEIASQVREGGSLHRAMDDSEQFPPLMVQMVASGEGSGKLEEMLDRAAVNQERELEMMLASMMSAFQPLMVLFMAGLVLTIVLAVLLPMFELNDLVQ